MDVGSLHDDWVLVSLGHIVKRAKLVTLAKRYGVSANGKTSVIVERLREKLQALLQEHELISSETPPKENSPVSYSPAHKSQTEVENNMVQEAVCSPPPELKAVQTPIKALPSPVKKMTPSPSPREQKVYEAAKRLFHDVREEEPSELASPLSKRRCVSMSPRRPSNIGSPLSRMSDDRIRASGNIRASLSFGSPTARSPRGLSKLPIVRSPSPRKMSKVMHAIANVTDTQAATSNTSPTKLNKSIAAIASSELSSAPTSLPTTPRRDHSLRPQSTASETHRQNRLAILATPKHKRKRFQFSSPEKPPWR
ncbi:hypothetical protein SJAG_01340 [Schizosaccharomyces japonicus yFS275]|uniref:Uncharacterized protein n=1 Tax=Schizosaccharomyces japonicus (strain yFS275 / FY16936) TaxID=402676 RepID=B6K0E6_SCHJY|nr:hypothetical protein SJAG_01340 [Schizosaccharomyces japonicus yFS275]EEB06296.1 hypothetical protein SJAG_01340 [Schizosaccharomyces japonicus yFS275]